MVKDFLRYGSNFLARRQAGILSAASVIMLMIAVSRVLGLFRNRVLAHFFVADTLSVYFAAFRLPEVIFEVLIFGALSSAFIPVFTSYLSRKQEKEAWHVAAISLNFAVLIFLFFALLIFALAQPLYRIMTPGFDSGQIAQVAQLARILIFSQIFFVFSYFLTGVLESMQRFLVPALAPLFYNLGIILGTIFLAPTLGIYGAAIGAVIGACLHFLIQLPLAIHLGFRPKFSLNLSHPGVREIGRLAWPRVIELSFLQLGKSAELFLASLVSAAAYTYYTFANSLQLLPIGLFGISIAKASLPSLSYQSARGDIKKLALTFSDLFGQILFLILPCAVFLAVLRIPLVRLVFGAARFTWESTVQTGLTLSAFSLAIFSQALVYLLTRTFYALHDTLTPVKVSVVSILLNIFLGIMLVIGLRLPIWSLALSYSLSSLLQFLALCLFLRRRLPVFSWPEIFSAGKIFLASFVAGVVMHFLLKTLDRFILDTRYISNLVYLTFAVGLMGLLVYLGMARVLRIKEMSLLVRVLRKIRRLESLTI